MRPNIGIPEDKLTAITDLLSKVLSDQVVLYTKTRKFHWNVGGESFMELHKLFESQYTQLEMAIDETAERISKLGSKTIGTLSEFSKLASLKENPDNYPSSKEMIKELLHDHETVIMQLRKFIEQCDEEYKDAGTTDFLTAKMEEHETIAWTLRRYLN
jgi:starvation-inducible DNA-binding protein